MIPEERHNEDEILLKALPEQIFVVFFRIDKSRPQNSSSIQTQL